MPRLSQTMAKTRQQKEAGLQQLVENLKTAKAVVFANFQGLKVKESEELRALCRKEHVTYMASKKTLVALALAQASLDVDAKAFAGGVSIACGTSDDVTPAQIVVNFGKKHEAVKIFGGVLEGAFIDAAKVSELAKLPSKQQLLGQFVGTLNAPISGFVNVLAGNLRGLVNVLNALKEKKPV